MSRSRITYAICYCSLFILFMLLFCKVSIEPWICSNLLDNLIRLFICQEDIKRFALKSINKERHLRQRLSLSCHNISCHINSITNTFEIKSNSSTINICLPSIPIVASCYIISIRWYISSPCPSICSTNCIL